MILERVETTNQSKKFLKLLGPLSLSPEAIREYHFLHREAVSTAKGLSNHEFKLIEILQKIDDKRVYRFMKFRSLSQYARIALKLSEPQAYLYVGIARKARGLAQMQASLKDGSLKISQAKRICSVVTPKNEAHWVKLAVELSQRNLEREIARVNPKTAVLEGTKFVSEKDLELRAAIDLESEQIFRRAQDVLSQSLGRAATFNETIKAMGRAYLNQKDPVVKAQRMISKRLKKESKAASKAQTTVSQNSPRGEYQRKPLGAELVHELNARDLGKCQYPLSSGICGEGRWVDHHHIIPVGKGGKNILENLITLCRGHHQMQHAIASLPSGKWNHFAPN